MLVPNGLKLLPYQDDGVAFVANKRAALIADDMGLGKTVQALAAVNIDPSALRVLVICPASLKYNWAAEAKKWLTLPFDVALIEGGKPQDFSDFTIINYDILAKHHDALRARKWDLMIVDEAHALKNPEANRTEEVLGLRTGRPIPAKRKLFLTGTPIENRPIEIWTLLHGVSPRVWSSQHAFALRYCNARQEYQVVKTYKNVAGRRVPAGHTRKLVWDYSGASNLEELKAKLGKFMIRRMKEDVLVDLPEKTRRIIEVDGKGRKQVMREKTVRQMVEKLAPTEIEFNFSRASKIRHEDALAAVPKVIKYLQEVLETQDKVLVFAHHRDVLDDIEASLAVPSVKVMGGMSAQARNEAVRAFQEDPSCRVFLGQHKAAGEGLTLTAGCHVIVAEPDWVPGRLQQLEDRVYRIGQKRAVTIDYIVVKGSLSSYVLTKVVDKMSVIDKAINPNKGEEPKENTPCLFD